MSSIGRDNMQVCVKCNEDKKSRQYDKARTGGHILRKVCRKCRILASAVGGRYCVIVINR